MGAWLKIQSQLESLAALLSAWDDSLKELIHGFFHQHGLDEGGQF